MAQPDQSDQFFPTWERFLPYGWVGAAIAVVAVGYGFLSRGRSQVYVPDAARVPAATQWTSDTGLTVSPSFSRDQKFVVYASDRSGAGNLSIWIRPYPSGEPRQLTTEPFNDSDPDISPDGSHFAYRSERNAGGIYLASTSEGGRARLLSRGLRPRFSPDGKWIAYYDTDGGSVEGSSVQSGRIFIVSPDGGAPKRIREDFAYATHPVWTSDGHHLLFEGSDQQGWQDWWVTPLEGGPAKATHILELLRDVFPTVYAPERLINGNLLFSAAEQEHAHLWEIAVSEANWKASAAPRRVTDGSQNDQVGTIGKDGKLMFSRMRAAENVWSLPVDADHGTARGELRQITFGDSIAQSPSISPDGTKLVYISDKTGIRDIWLRNPATGAEESITAFNPIGYRPALAFHGNRVVYPTSQDGRCAVLVKDLSMTAKASPLPGCFNVWDWSADGSSMLVYTPADRVQAVDSFSPASGQRAPLLSHSSVSFYDAAFSPDGRWITFTAGLSPQNIQTYVAPFRGTSIRESEWIGITREGGGFGAWSPNGDLLYFHSNRDGFPCVWSQRLDAGKHPAGPATPVMHFHAISLGTYLMRPSDFRMSVSKDQLVLNLIKQTANLWVTKSR
jgi:Tol biopolymer transport system component